MASELLKEGNSHVPGTVVIPEDADLSILQQPLNLGVKNVKQILKCIESGSREVKDIILNECNIVYECKVCLSLFRSLANFLYHKRGFCKKHLCENMLLFETFDETETTVVHPEPVKNEKVQENTVLISDSDCMETEKGSLNKSESEINKEKEIYEANIENETNKENEADMENETNKKNEADMENETNKENEAVMVNDANMKDEANVETEGNKEKEENKLAKEDEENQENVINVDSENMEVEKVDDAHVESPSSENEDVIVVDTSEENGNDTNHKSECGDKKAESDGDNDIIMIQERPQNVPKLDVKINDLKENFAVDKAHSLSLENNIKMKDVIPIILKPIIGNKSAVFQVVKRQSFDACSVKFSEQKKSPGSLQPCQKAEEEKKVIIVVPNKSPIPANCTNESVTTAKPKDIHLTRRKKLLNRNDCSVQGLKCLKCNTHFTTLKTLYFHMMSFHSLKRMYFPCPFCKSLFVQMYGVTRHLIQVHGKTKDQINNKMRDAIRKTAIWKRVSPESSKEEEEQHEASEKENDRKESFLKNDAKVEDKLPETELTHNKLLHSYVKVENSVTLHPCSKCQRVFSRKSSQVSHEKFCIMNSPNKVESVDQVIAPLVHSSPPPSLRSPENEKKTVPETKVSVRPKRGAEKQMHKDFVDSQTLKWRSANKIETAKSPSLNVHKKAIKTHERKILSMVDAEKLLCLKCNRKFSSFSNLRRHAAIHIGWTRFKCKCCEYQSYNKSDCIHHIERMHASLPEGDAEKYVVNLITEHSPTKPIQQSPKSVSPTKVSDAEKKNTSGRRKKGIAKKLNLEKKKPQVPTPQKRKHSRSDTKVSASDKPVDSKKKKTAKSLRMQTKLEPQCVKKLPNNYRSVTTNSPTTIILSKTCSSSTVQITKNTAPIPIHHADILNDKGSVTRISPRKTETPKSSKSSPSSLDNAENVSSKSNVVKIRVPCQITAKSNTEEKNAISPEKSVPKKGRFISDWFLKKDFKNATDTSVAVSRRDNAPVIIDLFSASGVQRSKNASLSPTK